jgi:hypothetical protein
LFAQTACFSHGDKRNDEATNMLNIHQKHSALSFDNLARIIQWAAKQKNPDARRANFEE